MTRSQGPGGGRLRIGFVPGVTLTKWRRIWAERFPGVPLEVVEVAAADQRRVLDDGDVDMCFVRLPLESEGLHAIPLYDEVMVAWASKEHPVTVFDQLTMADLAEERVLEGPGPDGIDLAAHSGAVVLLVPMSIARSHSRRDMAYRAVVDAPPSTVALAWPVARDDRWLDEFIGVVRGRTPNSSRTARERGEGKSAERTQKPVVAAESSRPAARRRYRRR